MKKLLIPVILIGAVCLLFRQPEYYGAGEISTEQNTYDLYEKDNYLYIKRDKKYGKIFGEEIIDYKIYNIDSDIDEEILVITKHEAGEFGSDFIIYDTKEADGTLVAKEIYRHDFSNIKPWKVDACNLDNDGQADIFIGVVYVLPNRIFLDISEREEKYQVFYRSQYIIIDKNGIVLRISNDKSSLLTIESYTDIVYNVGDSIQFAGVENNKKIFDAIEYLNNEYGSDAVSAYFVDLKNSFLFETLYGTKVRIDLSEDVGYQIVFAMKIINERLNNNLTVTGLIDFTKGDSPVYIEE
jgi:hypothetical protein